MNISRIKIVIYSDPSAPQDILFHSKVILTLRSDENERNVLDVSELHHLDVVVVDGAETVLILQTVGQEKYSFNELIIKCERRL